MFLISLFTRLLNYDSHVLTQTRTYDKKGDAMSTQRCYVYIMVIRSEDKSSKSLIIPNKIISGKISSSAELSKIFLTSGPARFAIKT